MPFSDSLRSFVESARWTFAKTYATTWPHEYVVLTNENAGMIVELARHVVDHGTDGPFYAETHRYYHEGGKVYWSMDPSPETTTLINRCDEAETYQARLLAGTLPRQG
ncbi:MAG: hypothetical protein ABIS03_03520 [Gemmatimonadaceae bacterium]